MNARSRLSRAAFIGAVSVALAAGGMAAAAVSTGAGPRDGYAAAQLPGCPSVSGWTFIDRTGNPDPDVGGSFDCNYEKPAEFGQVLTAGLRATFVGPEGDPASYGDTCGAPDSSGTDRSATRWARVTWPTDHPETEAPAGELLASVEQIAQSCEGEPEPSPSPTSEPTPSPSPTSDPCPLQQDCPSPSPTPGSVATFEWNLTMKAEPKRGPSNDLFLTTTAKGKGDFEGVWQFNGSDNDTRYWKVKNLDGLGSGSLFIKLTDVWFPPFDDEKTKLKILHGGHGRVWVEDESDEFVFNVKVVSSQWRKCPNGTVGILRIRNGRGEQDGVWLDVCKSRVYVHAAHQNDSVEVTITQI